MRKFTLFEAAAALARIEFGGVLQGTFLESAVLQLTVGDYSGALATASFGLRQSVSPEQAWKAPQIAKRVRCSVATVYRHLPKNGQE